MMHKWIGTGCCVAVLLMVASFAWGAPQDDQANPSARRTWREPSGYTVTEYNAYQAARLAKNPADRMKLLDDFVAGYPTSSLVPFAYQEYYELYLSQRTYPKAIEYLDKLIPLDETDLNARLSLLVMRAQTFLMGCDASELRTPEGLRSGKKRRRSGPSTAQSIRKAFTRYD
jgi:tetratricopeptide (TPR) repeat protein